MEFFRRFARAFDDLNRLQQSLMAAIACIAFTWTVFVVRSSSGPAWGTQLQAFFSLMFAGLASWMTFRMKPASDSERGPRDIAFFVVSLSFLLTFVLLQLIWRGYHESYLNSLVTILVGVLIALAAGRRVAIDSPQTASDPKNSSTPAPPDLQEPA